MKYEIFYNKSKSPFIFGIGDKPTSLGHVSKWYSKVHTLEMGGDVSPNLEAIFALFNLGNNPLATPRGQDRIRRLGVGHTSISVGDIVKVDGNYYYCDKVGWKKMRLQDSANRKLRKVL